MSTSSTRRDLMVYAACSVTVMALAFAASTQWGRAESTGKPQKPELNCPDVSRGETAEDCPWGGAARAMIAAAEGGRTKDVVPLFKELLPDLDRALQSDSHRNSWKLLWGRSINFDELAKDVIVHPAIVAALGERFGNRALMVLTHIKSDRIKGITEAEGFGKPITTDPAGHQLVHAGLEHTYGYLFSLLKTSFGYKRARWVRGEIERGFGIKVGLLSPHAENGTLFSNVTYFAGQIAFRGDEQRLATLNNGAKDLPSEIRDFDFSKLAPTRLEETLEAKDSRGESRKVILRTDLIPFFHPQADTHLLVYSIVDPLNGGDVLVTAFPVAQSFVDSVLAADGLGDAKPVQTRYNGFVDGVSGVNGLTGSRRIIK